MASIFKRDKRKRNANYWIQYTNHIGKRKTVKGFTDRGLTEQLAAKLENEAMLRQRGLIDPQAEQACEQRKTSLEEHLTVFERRLNRADSTAKHVRLTMTRIRRIIDEAGFAVPTDIDAESVENVLREMRESNEIGHRTYNHYLQAIDQFCNWLVPKRLSVNPLAGLERLNTEVDVRHPRRALTVEEFGQLLQSARTSGVTIQCYDGEQRARIYLLSFLTGLRRKELGTLTPRNFDLDANPPILTVNAACSKHRRQDVLPLHPDLVPQLRKWTKGLADDEVLFPKLAKRRTWLMVKKDLERVGIPYQTKAGIADFHAAGRHTHITELFRNGASITEAKELARHTDVRMTMKYTHIGLEDQAKAVAALPIPKNNDASEALQMRCNSGVTTEQSTSASDTASDPANDKNPCGDRGFVEDRHPVSPDNFLEAAGITNPCLLRFTSI